MLQRLYDALILKRPWVPLLVCLALVAASAAQLPEFRLDADSDSLTLESDPDRDIYVETRKEFGTDDYIILAFAPESPWGDGALQRLDALTKDLEALETIDVEPWGSLPAIDRVLSPTNQRLFRSTKQGVFPMQALSEPQFLLSESTDREKAQEELTNSAFYGGNLVASDSDAFAVIAYFKPNDEQSAREAWQTARDSSSSTKQQKEEAWAAYRDASDREQARVRALVAEVRSLAEKHGADGSRVYASGVPTIVVDMVNAIEEDMILFGVFVVGFMVLVMGLVLKRLRWVTLPLAAAVVVVGVIVAATVIAGKKTTVVTSNLSSLMLIVGLAHAIHIAVYSREVRRKHPDMGNVATVRETVRGIWKPCLYACLTTSVGFASIAVSDIRPCIDFGIAMAAGTVLAWLVSFTLIPAGMTLISPERLQPLRSASRKPMLPRLAKWTIRNPAPIIAGGALMFAIAIAGILKLEVETRFTDYFKEDNPIAQGLDFIDRRIGGTIPVEVILRGDGEGYFLEKENFERVRRVHDYLDAIPETGTVLSLASVQVEGTKVMNHVMGFPGEPEIGPLVTMLQNNMGQEATRKELREYVSEDFSVARLQVRVRETAETLKRQELLKGLREFVRDDAVVAEGNPKVTGMFVLYTNMLQSLTTSQEATLLLVIAALWVMFLALFRSFKIATLAMIPNVIPILFTLGTMGLAGIPLDMMTIMIASVSMGMAVDATIHYTHRYLAERKAGRDPNRAVIRCHESIGQAVMFTDVTVAGGFWVLIFSNFKPTIYFGLFTSVATVAAILAALVLLPVLLRRFAK
ncbi:MAG: efflux RND transporter permease subunit [Planctomycetota bacterium]|jgi:predicted RND superfamily exporter protein